MHHVAWAVEDATAALDALARAGARLIDESPRPGLHGTPVAFIHPKSMGGVLVELVEVAGAR
jgi:methylmalonyl-CoA/ethylmalonyl-CoA epimerase